MLQCLLISSITPKSFSFHILSINPARWLGIKSRNWTRDGLGFESISRLTDLDFLYFSQTIRLHAGVSPNAILGPLILIFAKLRTMLNVYIPV